MSTTIPNTPLEYRYHDRLQWKPVEGKGVFVGEGCDVQLNETALMPRVVIRGKAQVLDPSDVLTLGPIGSRGDWLTVTFRPSVQVTTGCMTESLEEFEREVLMKDEKNVYRAEYEAAIELIRVLAETRRKG